VVKKWAGADVGVPHHAPRPILQPVVERGYAIAICDQVEDASVAAAQSRQVRREVTRSDAWLCWMTGCSMPVVITIWQLVIAGNHWGLAYMIFPLEIFTTQAVI